MNDDMKIMSDGPVILLLPIMNDALTVMYVYTPPPLRGKGLMRSLLARLTEWADDESRDLFLMLSPDEDTDIDRLRAFYETIGFEAGSDGIHMIRRPEKTVD